MALLPTILLFLALAEPAPPGWRLVWSDEFTEPGLPNPARWTYEEGSVRNNELQYYTRAHSENARVENGFLIIETRKEKFANGNYTSASVITKGIAQWQYARVEVRARLPRGRGLWPAIWMLGSDRERVGWPACGEIDIMENVGFEPDLIYGTVHTAKYNHVKGTQRGSKITLSEPYADFHVYAMEWDENRMDFFVDGNQYFSFENEKTGRDAWPFDQPMYLILNVAYGGSWGGQKGVDDSALPQSMAVDYVRVYQRASGRR